MYSSVLSRSTHFSDYNIIITRLLQKYIYTNQALTSLYSTLSPERLSTYKKMANNHQEHTVLLYYWNIELGQAFYFPLQILEVSLRNTTSKAIEGNFGKQWYSQANFQTTLSQWAKQELNNSVVSKHRTKKHIQAGDIIAQLSFSFWRELLKSRYEPHIWKKHLKTAFPCIPVNRGRQDIYDNVDQLLKLRNRISHHEPIINPKLIQLYQVTLDTIGWICPETKQWVEYHSKVIEVYNNRPLCP